MGKVTVITSGKGGAGKSTVSCGLGAALVRRGRRVLLVDADAGLRSLDYMLGISQELVFDLADVVSGSCEPAQAIYPCPACKGLFVLPAPQNTEDIVSPPIMKQLISALARYYDHILVDCPAGIGRGFQAAVAPAHRALVVSTPDPICLRDADKVRRLLEKNGVRDLRLVVNRFAPKRFFRSGTFTDLDAVIDAAGIQLIAVIPQDDSTAVCAAKGVPIAGRAPAALAFNRLAARLEGENAPLVL